MAFVRANSGGWAVGDVLTSAQQNALDIDHANALDKTVAGDTLSGAITLAGTGSIILPFTDGVVSSVNFGVVGNATSAIASVTPGGIACLGGATDWVGLSTRNRVVRTSPIPLGTLTAAWTMNTGSGGGDPDLAGTAAATSVNLWMPVHNGATLTGVTVWLEVGLSHSSTPFAFPSFDIRRIPIATGAGSVSMFAGGAVFASAATGAAWFNGGAIQSWSGTPNQNNVIDSTQYAYCMFLTDENGANSHTGNVYFGMQYTFSSITTMAFP